MKNIKVNLKTDCGTFQIGEINLDPTCIGAVDSEFSKEEIYIKNVCTISQVGALGIECEGWAYLYMLCSHTDKDIYSFHYVETGMLYDETGYFSEVEVGERLKTNRLDMAYKLFADKVIERWN